jgi:hypothetical protein
MSIASVKATVGNENSIQTFGSFLPQIHKSHQREGVCMVFEKLSPGIRKSKRSSFSAIILISLCSLALTDISHAAGRVFYDGFESGVVNAKWRSDGDSPLCSVVSSAVDGVAGPYAGTKMVSCNTSTNANFDNLVLDTNNYSDVLLIRTRVRVDKDMDRTVSSSKKILRFFYWTGSVYHDLFAIIRPASGLNNESHSQLNVTENTYWGGASGDNTANSSSWHKVEYYIRQSTGAMKVWHDGVLVRNELGLNYVGVKWSPFYITSNFSDSHDGTNHVYFDEFEVFSDLGTGATGLMSSATITQGSSAQSPAPESPAPGAPSSLQVVVP